MQVYPLRRMTLSCCSMVEDDTLIVNGGQKAACVRECTHLWRAPHISKKPGIAAGLL